MAASEVSAKLDAPPQVLEGAAGECLSEEDVLAFASGTLKSSRHAEAHFHFDQCEVCQRLLSEAAHALATAVSAPLVESDAISWHTTFQPGTLVGHRYLIRHFIARGGMGEVYEAFDRDLQQRVALKTVTSTACDNASAVRRLKAEVQLARRVSHPNVCRIYDFGTHLMAETDSAVSFLTMEFVEGETLGQRLRSTGALPIEDARKLGRQLLQGLNAAHEAGVLHRDFKSDNVMLREEANGGCSPLILDFGLARALDDGARTNSSSSNPMLGTFSYIAPEQLQGRPHSTASDVYSFGIVWFEMLTGKLPFVSQSSPLDAALARLRRSAVAPSSKNPLVPADLDSIVLGCLRRSPKDRFRTASEVLGVLDALEARTRDSFQKRKLAPLTIAAVLGAVTA
ncbi:MAG TPA: serine/threonine-protein kinase, partial [Polyangiaceae bacterium]